MADFDLSKITGREPPLVTDDERDAEIAYLSDVVANRDRELAALRARVAALERAADNVIRCNTFGCAFPHPSFCPAQCQADQALRAALRLSGNKSEVRE